MGIERRPHFQRMNWHEGGSETFRLPKAAWEDWSLSQTFLESVCLALCVRRDSRVSAIWELSPIKRENRIRSQDDYNSCALHAILTWAGPKVILKVDPNI